MKILKLYLLLIIFLSFSETVFAVTKSEMEESQAITARVYLRWQNDMSGYLDGKNFKSLSELKKILRNKEKENLKEFEKIKIPEDYDSWTKQELINFWDSVYQHLSDLKKEKTGEGLREAGRRKARKELAEALGIEDINGNKETSTSNYSGITLPIESGNETIIKEDLLQNSANERFDKGSNPLLVALLIIAIFSGVVIWFFKFNKKREGKEKTNSSKEKATKVYKLSVKLPINTMLDHGKYRVKKVLGQGGFGITYLATDLGLDKLRAVKEFFPKDYCERHETTNQVSLGTTNAAGFVNRFKAKFIKEARNLANLDQHHGIIKIHTVFEDNNTAYYVMDYIEGESLSSMVKRSGPVPLDRAVKYITEVGEALEYVHKHRINHLDVKPANIMIRKKDDKPILIDFGLAKQYDSDGWQTSTTPTGVSHGFAPFEQYRAGGVNEFSPQTDVYSLAATLYYIVSGQIPPHATDLIENELTFPAGFPEALKEQIRNAMSSKRQNRPESVSTFIESLNQRHKHARNDSENSQQDEVTIIEYKNSQQDETTII